MSKIKDLNMLDHPQKQRTYPLPEKNFLRMAARGTWIGSILMDHGRQMKIVAIGQVRKDGRERLIDVTAVELENHE